MADGGSPGLTSPALTIPGTKAHPDPARRRLLRGMVVIVPMVVPAVMGMVVMLLLR